MTHRGRNYIGERSGQAGGIQPVSNTHPYKPFAQEGKQSYQVSVLGIFKYQTTLP